jgi:hypothetical protein
MVGLPLLCHYYNGKQIGTIIARDVTPTLDQYLAQRNGAAE